MKKVEKSYKANKISDAKNADLLKKSFKLTEHNKCVVAKYNMTLGESFIKDFIFICCIK